MRVRTKSHGALSGLDGDDHAQYHTDERGDERYAPLYDGPLQTAMVTVSSAELLALNATPKTLIAAPGGGKALILVAAELWLDYNGAAYAGIAAGEDLTIKYSNAAGATLATIETTGFLDATADALRYVEPTTTAAITPVANAPLVLHLLTGEITTGDSPLKLRLLYREITLAWGIEDG
ncbi:MAG: hypothetical protein P9F19_01465 [Candidatus Contendobacter sp.]|nr:hypothetical protein [Candidatus Contendobacter sp.]MDG4556058.1 hypothetical protein [Candidatus Contendobacter sp.]